MPRLSEDEIKLKQYCIIRRKNQSVAVIAHTVTDLKGELYYTVFQKKFTPRTFMITV